MNRKHLAGLLQFSENVCVTLPGKDKRPQGIPKSGGLVGERSQFIREGQFADVWTDVVDGIEGVPQIGNSGNAGTSPWVGAPAARDGGEK